MLIIIIIIGSYENSELDTPIPFVKNKLRSILLDFQKVGDPILRVLLIFAKLLS